MRTYREAHACMQAKMYEHLASNANEERRRRCESAYAGLELRLDTRQESEEKYGISRT